MIVKRYILLTLLCAGFAVQAETTAFVNISLVPMSEETVIDGQTVIVVDGLISQIGEVDSVPVPEGATVVDGTDRYLMPGLVEMHAHIPGVGTEALERVLTLFAVNGVTTVRGMLGRQSHLQLRADLQQGRVFGPRLVTSGPSLNGNSVSGPADARAKVRAQFDAG